MLIQVAERVTARDEFARQILLRMVLPQGVLILLSGIAVWYGVGRGLAPLSMLRREIESRSHRDLSALPEEQAPREVRPLIRAINDLLARLGIAIANQQRFIADAAHQLRTPIAGLKTQTELALRQSQPGNVPDTLSQLQTATEQTTRLVNQLLSLARAEPGAKLGHTVARLDIARLARDATTEWVPRALARRIDLGYDGEEGPAWIEGDSFLVHDMLGNLLDNARKFAKSQVKISFVEGSIVVEDDGPGVADAELSSIRQRGRKLDESRKGFGLGLAIVEDIAGLYELELSYGRAASGGLQVKIAFDRKGAAA